MKPEKLSFWLTNLSDRNVSLTDLNLTIKAFTSVNLLDNRHYKYTLEQLNKSVESGSVFKKRDKIILRSVAPEILISNIPLIREAFIPSRERSVLVVKQENYEELNLTDEEFAKDNADIAELDSTPMLKKV